MPESPDQPALPGDIVQITDKAERWYLALLVVEENMRWGLKAHALVPTAEGVNEAYYRLKHGSYQIVGTAVLVPGEIATARKHAIRTQRDLASEKDAAK